MLRFKPSYIPASGWLLLVTFLLSLPGKEFPTITWLSEIWFDKWVHFGLFMMLVVLWCWAISGKNPEGLKKLFTQIALLSILYGVVMELVQHFFIPFRGFEFMDIVADGVGSFAGLILSSRWFIKK